MTKIESFSPLPESITIKSSDIHGLGLFATQDIAKGVELGISHFENEDAKDGIVRTPLGAFVNHSAKPNADIIDGKKQWTLVASQDIKSGDEITVDYTPWYDEEIIRTYK